MKNNDFNNIDRKTFCDMFSEIVEKFPDKEAIISEMSSITYKNLNLKSNIIAHFLKRRGYEKDIIAIKTERSINAIIAMIGIWKASCAFVFLDSTYPQERLDYIVDICNCPLIFTEELIYNLINTSGNNVNFIYNGNDPEGLATIIFTSGSTGKPKGVMLIHKNIAALAKTHYIFNMNSDSIFGVFANFCFVAIISDIFITLSIGGTVNIIPTEIRKNIDKLAKYYIDNKITITFLPPHMACKFINIDTDNVTLRTLIVGSEQARNLKKRHYNICHVYGSSETCSTVAYYYVESEKNAYPIGKFKENIKYYILDENEKEVPKGEVGELCLSGPQISIGYINNKEKTSLCYVNNKFTNEEDYKCLFKSGDLVKELPNGNVKYVTRKDWMFKIRGFRVESTEVEIEMLKFNKIKEASVTAFEDSGGTNILCGYYTSDKDVNPDDIKEFLHKNLPDYMVPTFLIQLEELPRNSNNKVKKSDLPKPDVDYSLHKATH